MDTPQPMDIIDPKQEMIEEILSLTGRNNEERVELCKFYLNKHNIVNYSLINNQKIKQKDYILKDMSARSICETCINDNRCLEKDIRFIISKMSYEDLVYMGI